jgi:hypothetical protein
MPHSFLSFKIKVKIKKEKAIVIHFFVFDVANVSIVKRLFQIY